MWACKDTCQRCFITAARAKILKSTVKSWLCHAKSQPPQSCRRDTAQATVCATANPSNPDTSTTHKLAVHTGTSAPGPGTPGCRCTRRTRRAPRRWSCCGAGVRARSMCSRSASGMAHGSAGHAHLLSVLLVPSKGVGGRAHGNKGYQVNHVFYLFFFMPVGHGRASSVFLLHCIVSIEVMMFQRLGWPQCCY